MRQWGEFTDFYSSEHARNVGKMFRDPDNALLPSGSTCPLATTAARAPDRLR